MRMDVDWSRSCPVAWIRRAAGFVVFIAFAFGTAEARAADRPVFQARLLKMEQALDRASYEMAGPSQAVAAAAIVADADSLSAQFPRRGEPLVIKALALCAEGAARGGMSGLVLVTHAKATLEKAQAIDPDPLGDGSLPTTLGMLYDQVPAFPIGFGNKLKARDYLLKGLSINPDGGDTNHYFGDFLYRQGSYTEAERFVLKALAAPPRPAREVGDVGRKRDAQVLLAKIRERVRTTSAARQ